MSFVVPRIYVEMPCKTARSVSERRSEMSVDSHVAAAGIAMTSKGMVTHRYYRKTLCMYATKYP